MLPRTGARVPRHTRRRAQHDIRENLESNVSFYSAAGPAAIEHRLEELDREWDIDRVVELHAACASLVGLALGNFIDRRFYAIPTAIGALLLSHACCGAYPPLLLFRRLGIRTAQEINEERYRLIQVLDESDA